MSIAEPRKITDGRFYFVGGTLRPGALCYVERRADRELYEALTRGDFCYVLTSRQMGKSSLMARTAARLREEGILVVMLDLTAVGQNVTPEQWYEGLLDAIGMRLDLEDELAEFWTEHAHVGPLRRWMRALREVVLPAIAAEHPARPPGAPERPRVQEGGLRAARFPPRLVLFLDEIDAVRSLPFSTDEFFAAIRECYNRRAEEPLFEEVTFCLLGVAAPSDLIRDSRTTPFNIGRRIVLDDFTPEEAAPLRIGLVLGGPDSSGRSEAQARALLKRVLFWTRGHPYLTQRLCEAVAEDRTVADAAGVDRWCVGLLLSPRARERDDNLLFARERLLRRDPDSGPDLAALLELYGRIRAGNRVPMDDTNPLIDLLRLSGIVRVAPDLSLSASFLRALGGAGRGAAARGGAPQGGTGRLRVRNPIYARVFDRVWVRRHMPDAELQRQRAAYRRGLARASVLASVVLAAVGGLGLTAMDQAGKARVALRGREAALGDLRVSLDRVERESARANDAARKNAELAEQREKALKNAVDQSRRADAEAARANESARRARRAAAGEAAARRQAIRRAEEARRHLYVANMNQIQSDWETANLGRIRRILNETRSHPGRGFEWSYWDRQCRLELRTLSGHAGAVYCARFSPDGRRAITGSRDRTARVWDAATGTTLFTLRGHESDVSSACFSGNGLLIATAGDNTARIWDAATGRALRAVRHRGRVRSVAFSPDDRSLVTASEDGSAKVWDAGSGAELLTLRGHASWVTSAVFSADGGRIATAGVDRTARVWDAATGRELRTCRGHEGALYSVAFAPDGRRLVTAGSDGKALVWDARTGGELFSVRGDGGEMRCAIFSPDGGQIAAGGEDHYVRVWDATTGEFRFPLPGHELLASSVCYSPDGRRILTASWDRTARIWDAGGPPRWVMLQGHQGPVTAVRFSPDGRRLATASEDGTVRVWDAAGGRELLKLRGDDTPVWSADWSPDGRRLAASTRGTARVWDAATGRLLVTLLGHQDGPVRAVGFSPDGRRIVTGSGADYTVRVWDAASGRTLLTLRGHAGPVKSASYSRDGRRILSSAEDGTVRVWSVATGRETMRTPPDREGWFVWAAAFSPDGRRIVCGSGTGPDAGRSWVLDAATGRELGALAAHTRPVTCVAYSRDGRRILTAGEDDIRLWDAATRRELLTFPRGTHYAAISPDGRRVAARTSGRLVVVWSGSDQVSARTRSPAANDW